MDTFGIYSAVYSIYLLSLFAFYAVVIEPISVLGIGKSNERQIRHINYQNIYFCAATIAILIPATLIQYLLTKDVLEYSLSTSIAFISLIFFNFLLILLKRYSYNDIKHQISFYSSVLYLITLSMLVAVMYLSKNYYATLAVGVKTALSLLPLTVASLVAIIPLRAYLSQKKMSYSTKVLKLFFLRYFSVAKWMLVNAMVIWSGKYLYSNYTGLKKGFDTIGVIRIAETFFLPIEQLVTVIGVVTLPKAIRLNDSVKAEQLISTSGNKLALLCTGYILFILLTYQQLTKLLFDEDAHQQLTAGLILSFGAITITRIIVDFNTGLILRLKHKHHLLMTISIVSLSISVIPSLMLINKWGLSGLVYAYLTTSLVQIAIALNIESLALIFQKKYPSRC